MPYAPDGWPDRTAKWLWNSYWRPFGMAHGDAYFRKTFTVSVATAVDVWAAADDAFELWLDGNPLLSDGQSGGYTGASKKAPVVLSSGSHVIAVKATNADDTSAGFICAVMAGATVVVHSDATWKMLAYPVSPPGFTPGQVIRLLCAEAAARGTIPEVALGFTDAADSAGNPWPVTSEIALPVAADLLTVLRQLAETYCDLQMAVGTLTLFAYAHRGVSTGVVLTPGVNLTALSHVGAV